MTLSKKTVRIILGIILVLLITALGFTVFFSVMALKQTDTFSAYEPREHHIIVTGTRSNYDFLIKLYEGVSENIASYNAVAELVIPDTEIDTESLKSSLAYAGYAGVDGVIVYNEDENYVIESPCTVNGRKIPVVVTGSYNPENDAICFIGANRYELGKAAVQLILKNQNRWDNILAIVSNSENSISSGRILSSMQEYISGNAEGISLNVVRFNTKGMFLPEDKFRDILLHTECDCVFCFTANDTVRAAQAVIDANLTDKVMVAGFYENEKNLEYVRKEIIAGIITVDAVEIGRRAVDELFSWLKNGYANSFITTDVKVIDAESFKREAIFPEEKE